MAAALNSNAPDVGCIGSQVRQRNIVHFPASRDRVTTVVNKMHCGQRFMSAIIEGNNVVLPGSPGLCGEMQGSVQASIYRRICRQRETSSPLCRSKGDGVPP